MLSYHGVEDLEGKITPSILDMYQKDFKNLHLASIVAGFHRAFGLRDAGNSISMEIVNSIKDCSEDIRERNLLVWNLYILSREFIDEELYDEALLAIERAEKNWSRDIIQGDDVGVYHISWIEQLWLRKAEIYLLLNDNQKFQEITDKILMERLNYLKECEEINGEDTPRDRCLYNCLEIMAFQSRKVDTKKAVSMIKQAIRHKAGLNLDENYFRSIEEIEGRGFYEKAFDLCIKYYYKLQDVPFDNEFYGYRDSSKNSQDFISCRLKDDKLEGCKKCVSYEYEKRQPPWKQY